MRPRMTVVFALALLVGCGSGDDEIRVPVSPTSYTSYWLEGPPAASHGWFCGGGDFDAGEGIVTVTASPRDLHIELRTGTCGSETTTSLVAAAVGILESQVTSGTYHVMLGNPTDESVNWRVDVEYPLR